MGRSKKKREYSFKPVCKEFAPVTDSQCDQVTLEHDEIEAIFLIDQKNMYQDAAAKKMGVSRATLSTIIKNARFKVATALTSCKKIVINDEKESYILMVPTANKNDFLHTSMFEKHLAVFEIQKDHSYSVKYLQNPVTSSGDKPAKMLPKVATDNGVNFFMSSDAGTGLVNSLLAKGIFTFTLDKALSKKQLVDHIFKTVNI